MFSTVKFSYIIGLVGCGGGVLGNTETAMAASCIGVLIHFISLIQINTK